jgi:hypothetical protein
MKLTYAVRIEDFRALQRPFTTCAGKNAGFKGAMVACALIALLGVFCLVKGFGLPVGAFLIGLGFVAAGLAYLFDRRSVSKSKELYEKRIAAAYRQVHCPDQRYLETDENGFTLRCKCGSVTRPWSELTQFSENEFFFAVASKMGGQTIPKSAFTSAAEMTEFRALVSGKLNQDKPFTSRHFDFAHTSADYRHAGFLHIMKGGGWRGVLKSLAIFACAVYTVAALWRLLSTHNPAILAGLVAGLLGVPLLRILGRRRKHYFGPLRIHFSDEGLHLQDPNTQSRVPWSRFIGYVEDNKTLLLYHNPKQYRSIPKRALVGPAAGFQALVAAKLPRYDYRNPAPMPQAAASQKQTA